MHQRGEQQLLHKQAAVGALALQELPLRLGHLGLVQPGGVSGGQSGPSAGWRFPIFLFLFIVFLLFVKILILTVYYSGAIKFFLLFQMGIFVFLCCRIMFVEDSLQ